MGSFGGPQFSRAVSEKPSDGEGRNVTNLISRESERGSTRAVLLNLLIFLCALSTKSLLKKRTRTLAQMKRSQLEGLLC